MSSAKLTFSRLEMVLMTDILRILVLDTKTEISDLSLLTRRGVSIRAGVNRTTFV